MKKLNKTIKDIEKTLNGFESMKLCESDLYECLQSTLKELKDIKKVLDN